MKRNSKKVRKVKRLILACTLSAVVLIVATYTWFIGLQTVVVNPFEINIATTEGLFLSLDGNEWMYELDVNEANQYADNTNLWAENGLIPMSSIGELDSTISRMKLFELGSYTTTPGGYRLLASRVQNMKDASGNLMQGEGYIAFDLFIKNLSGEAYYSNLDTKNEEAIYLTVDSSVKVANSDADASQLNTGIENSIRVGFAQIGRVEATTSTVSTITGMDCTGTNMSASGYTYKTGDVTGICRNAQIWEPNETKHVQDALDWYKKSCAERTKAGSIYELNPEATNGNFAYDLSKSCTAVENHETKTGEYKAMQTYAVANVIDLYRGTGESKVETGVDIYDGLNKYTGNTMSYATYMATGTDKTSAKLVNYDYFTDEEKNKVGADRPEFMTLAPNSITKVRVYIWLEGQDIDNYNFAQLGKQISINFGFTKERFRAEEDSTVPPYTYEGPSFETSDPNYRDYTTTGAQS